MGIDAGVIIGDLMKCDFPGFFKLASQKLGYDILSLEIKNDEIVVLKHILDYIK